ncbi:MAG: sigma-70 family RNA polymerase sigma factor [Armatimonadetes bacterium]|nr:sigma-70 family RNA polymerase sigma factor [Armatimonadota bacterium]
MTPTHEDPPDALPPELQRAALRAVQRTDRLTPPPNYDPAYWREERTAIAHIAAWQAAHEYQPDRGVSLPTYATLRAEWAILDEWKRLQRAGWCLASLPVDEETGEVLEVVDPDAQALVEAHALCAQVRAAVAALPAAERRVVALRFGAGLSERAIAGVLGVSKSWVHRRLQSALARLRADLGVNTKNRGAWADHLAEIGY